MTMVRACLLACVLGLLSCAPSETDTAQSQDTARLRDTTPPHDWLIVPGTRIGPVDTSTSERQLIDLLGRERVVRRDAQIGEGFCAPGSVIYPGTADSVLVTWVDSTFSRPAVVTVTGPGSRWRTPAGARVGASLQELESMNAGKPIRFMGFGWDYGGTGSWSEPGSGKMGIVLHPDRASYETASRDPRFREIVGDHDVRSDHPLIRAMDVRLERMFIRWAEPVVQFQCKDL